MPCDVQTSWRTVGNVHHPQVRQRIHIVPEHKSCLNRTPSSCKVMKVLLYGCVWCYACGFFEHRRRKLREGSMANGQAIVKRSAGIVVERMQRHQCSELLLKRTAYGEWRLWHSAE
jgi:hypothetical protein